MAMPESAHLRIGALSRRVGVSPGAASGLGTALRAAPTGPLSRRFPSLLDGGRRACSARCDVTWKQGCPPPRPPGWRSRKRAPDRGDEAQPGELTRLSTELAAALDRLDEPGAHATLDRLLATFTLQTVLRDVVLPYLQELGERWERGEASVAQEHFASNVLRGRLLGLARGWGEGSRPKGRSRLCAGRAPRPAADHLWARARRTRLADHVPRAGHADRDDPGDADRMIEPRLVVISATTKQRLRAAQPQLAELVRHSPRRARRRRRNRRPRSRRRCLPPRRGSRHRRGARRRRTSMSLRSRERSWSSTQTRSPAGAFESVQRIAFPAPVVERSAAGARRLGEVYWREVERSTLGVIRTRADDRRVGGPATRDQARAVALRTT